MLALLSGQLRHGDLPSTVLRGPNLLQVELLPLLQQLLALVLQLHTDTGRSLQQLEDKD